MATVLIDPTIDRPAEYPVAPLLAWAAYVTGNDGAASVRRIAELLDVHPRQIALWRARPGRTLRPATAKRICDLHHLHLTDIWGHSI